MLLTQEKKNKSQFHTDKMYIIRGFAADAKKNKALIRYGMS